MKEYVAHARLIANASEEEYERHSLESHLLAVEALVIEFAEGLGGEFGGLAGRWHDLGKYRKKFQDYIRLKSGYEKENAHIENETRRPHSTAGAIHAIKSLPTGFGHILAYLIAGHHAGLPDWDGGKGSLNYRLKEGAEEYAESLEEDIPPQILSCDSHYHVPEFARPDNLAIWMRMLFSCLVDADFLDTEKFMNPEQSKARINRLTLMDLETRFEYKMAALQKNALNDPLTQLRNEIQSHCRKASEWSPGLFSLTVPTGGGKTLSSLAFALKHAVRYKKTRIIYAIPFTSIIEQNADVFRSFLGEQAVLEHHSNLDVEPDKEDARARLATENWDSPLIVTTNVQLFESLHASRTSRCRKLHNIVNSVIILDEAQQIPRDFHGPITKVMQQLSDYFGVTWVLCTATQPVLTHSKNTFGQILLEGLKNVREIIPEPNYYMDQFRRVCISFPKKGEPKKSWAEIAEIIKRHSCVLVIVNTRRHAHELFRLVQDEDAVHLSANMCAAHRSSVIREIKERLTERRSGGARPLRVVSTTVVEAGVDVDFPVVFRAVAGLDSIAQSAGRCNREGLLSGLGLVQVFHPEQGAPPGILKQGEQTTLELLQTIEIGDHLVCEDFHRYFSLMNDKDDRDKYEIINLLRAKKPTNDAPLNIAFRTAAERFRMIDNNGIAVVVLYCPDQSKDSPVHAWISMLEKDASQTWVYKKLQRYTITLPESVVASLVHDGLISVRVGLNLLITYDPILGASAPTVLSAEQSVI